MLKPPVYVDDVEVAHLHNGDAVQVTLSPGAHKVYSNDKSTGIELDAKAGLTYFVRVDIKTGAWKGHGQITLIDPQEGKFEFSKQKVSVTKDMTTNQPAPSNAGADAPKAASPAPVAASPAPAAPAPTPAADSMAAPTAAEQNSAPQTPAPQAQPAAQQAGMQTMDQPAAQPQQSLGDVARQYREKKAKAATTSAQSQQTNPQQ